MAEFLRLDRGTPTPDTGGPPRRSRKWQTAPVPAWLPLVIALVVGVASFDLLGALRIFDLGFVLRYIGFGVGPLLTSLEITTLSFAIGFGLAIPIALLRAYPPGRFAPSRRSPAGSASTSWSGVLLWPAYAIASAYVAAIRGTPFLVQVFLTYYAVIFTVHRLTFLGADAAFWAGLVALTVNTTAYQSEALRGGLQSVDSTQVEAAKAIGMGRWKTFSRVVFPQSLRLVTLPLTNEWISNFKTSAILSYITVVELFYWARTDIAYGLARPLEAFVMLTVFYLIINVSLSRGITLLEQRFRIPGLGSAPVETGIRGFGARA